MKEGNVKLRYSIAALAGYHLIGSHNIVYLEKRMHMGDRKMKACSIPINTFISRTRLSATNIKITGIHIYNNYQSSPFVLPVISCANGACASRRTSDISNIVANIFTSRTVALRDTLCNRRIGRHLLLPATLLLLFFFSYALLSNSNNS